MRDTEFKIKSSTCDLLFTSQVTGANHRKQGKSCQDASLACSHYYKGQPYTLLAVADGHGSEHYFRSEIGAHFAVQAISEVAAQWVMSAVGYHESEPDNWLANASNDFSSRFSRSVLKVWESKTQEHLSEHPYTEEQARFTGSTKPYGTTVAVALVFRNYLFAGSIGDSSVLLVKKSRGDLSAADILAIENKECLGLSTDSLVSSNAASSWKYKVYPLDEVRFICAVTDGFTDSLADVTLTLTNLYQDICDKGTAWFCASLPAFLERLTQDGVGDDVSAVFYLPKLLESVSESEMTVKNNDVNLQDAKVSPLHNDNLAELKT